MDRPEEVDRFSPLSRIPVCPGPQFSSQKTQILRKVGVIGFVGNGRGAAQIPDGELDGVRLLLRNRIPHASHPYLQVGQRIRVTDGALRGLEGILVGLGNKKRPRRVHRRNPEVPHYPTARLWRPGSLIGFRID